MSRLTALLQKSLWLVVPIILILSAIRIALTPIFISVEYRLPGFPMDEFGFSTSDRLFWADYSIDYLLGGISHQELTDTQLSDGSPLFNERELRHMLDVRILTLQVLNIWKILLAITVGIIGLTWATGQWNSLLYALKRGARITILLILFVLSYLAINFNQLFTQFHQIFFEGDSWLFQLSDNLIRLFPLRFWRDIFIFIAGAASLLSVLILVIPPKRLSRD